MKLSKNFAEVKQVLDQETINDKLEELTKRVRSVSQPKASASLACLSSKKQDKNVGSSINISVIGSESSQTSSFANRRSSKVKTHRVGQVVGKSLNKIILKQTTRHNCVQGKQSVQYNNAIIDHTPRLKTATPVLKEKEKENGSEKPSGQTIKIMQGTIEVIIMR